MKRSSAAIVVVVAVSLVLIGVLTLAGPRKEAERKGAAELTVLIDFGGQNPAHPLGNSTAEWGLDGGVNSTPGPALWRIHLRMDNATAYSALEAAAGRANFTLGADWYPNFRSHRVTEIAGVRDGTGDRYWQFYLNGGYSSAGADLTGLGNGDVVRWEFKKAMQ